MAVLGCRVVRGLVKDVRPGRPICSRSCDWIPQLKIKHNLPQLTLVIQTILSKIPNRYRKFCQGLGQDLGQPTGWMGVFRGGTRDFRLQ